jgi:general secretion pathway protein G
MIAMFILIILLTVAVPTYQYTIQRARESVLKENLWQMRRQIDQFASDKGKLPQSLDDLVQGGYLREIPVDPMTEKPDWDLVMKEDNISAEGGQGLGDVKSTADGTDSDNRAYRDY